MARENPDRRHLNPFRQKLSEDQRRLLVADVAQGLAVSRAAEKYGITPAAAWNLVNKEALRLLFTDVGFDGYTTPRYLRERALIDSTTANLTQRHRSPEQGPERLAASASLGDAARVAAQALHRLAEAADQRHSQRG